jgi:ATP-dependent RNA helicase DeaD
MEVPTHADVNEQRVARFRLRIVEAIAAGHAEPFISLVEEFEREQDVPAVEIAAALASLLQGGSPLLLKEGADGPVTKERRKHEDRERASPRSQQRLADEDTETFRIEVGYAHGVKPGNIVGAITNVAGLEGWQIGHVDIREDHTFVGLPRGLPREVIAELARTRVAGQALRIGAATDVPPKAPRKHAPKGPPKGARKGPRKPSKKGSRTK